METPVILVVDDEPDMEVMITAHFRREIQSGKYAFRFARDGNEAFMLLKAHPDIHIVLADIHMPGMDGLTMLKRIHQESYLDDRFKLVKVMMVTAYSDMPNIREAMHYGAIDFLTKPINFQELEHAIENAWHELSTLQEVEQFIGHSEPILRLKDKIRQMSEYSVNVLIEGETGVGKSLLAKIIHHGSCRRDGPFVDLHCGAIPSTLIESELFGHVKGAFTGAERKRIGKFQLADGGTLFLDEISTIGPDIQVKLLKAIDAQRFFPVGSDNAVQVDVRIIAATNESLPALVREKRFREDLYYRLKVVTLSIPPLRERKTDIPLLVNHFLEQLNRKYHQQKSISRSALEKLMYAPWQGNIRVLASLLENVFLFSPDNIIKEQDISIEDQQESEMSSSPRSVPSLSSDDPFSADLWIEHLLQHDCDVMKEMQQTLLRVALTYYRSNKSLLAKRLGMSRTTLYKLLQKYQLE